LSKENRGTNSCTLVWISTSTSDCKFTQLFPNDDCTHCTETLYYALLDLCEYLHRQEELLVEIRSQQTFDGSINVPELALMDSFLKESARLNTSKSIPIRRKRLSRLLSKIARTCATKTGSALLHAPSSETLQTTPTLAILIPTDLCRPAIRELFTRGNLPISLISVPGSHCGDLAGRLGKYSPDA
jgi:hypothetical protein